MPRIHPLVLFFFALMGVTVFWMENAYLSPPDSASYYSTARSLALDLDVDFANEYRAFRFQPNMFYLTEKDRLSNDWPIGSGLFWAPFLLLAHGIGGAFNAITDENANLPLDGFGPHYRLVAMCGVLIMGLAGLLAGWLGAARWTSKKSALAGILLLLLGTPFGFYFYYYLFMAHITSFFLVTLFCLYWMEGVGKERSVGEWGLLGILGGWMVLVRPQNAVVLVALAVEAYYALSQKEKSPARAIFFQKAVQKLLVFAACLVGAFLPQMLFWWRIYGNPLQMPKLEEMHWLAPRIDLMLFSTYHGLLSWSPVLLLIPLGLYGLYKHNRVVGAAFSLVVLLQVYINGANAIWWAGGSFGNRRFVDYSFIFILALAFCWRQWGRNPLLWAFALPAAFWNFALVASERAGILTLDRHIEWDRSFFRNLGDLLLSPGRLWMSLRGDFAQANGAERIISVMAVLGVSAIVYGITSRAPRNEETEKNAGTLPRMRINRRMLIGVACFLVFIFDWWMLLAIIRTERLDLQSPKARELVRALHNPEYGKVISRENRLLWNNHYEMGFYHMSKGNLAEAREAYEKARRLLPAHPSAYWYLGSIAQREGQLGAACIYFENALARRPGYALAMNSLTETYSLILDYQPSNEDVARKLTRLLAARKDYLRALHAARHLLDLKPDDGEAAQLVQAMREALDAQRSGQ